MRALVTLFGKSPFAPIQAHMEKVAVCVEKIQALFDAQKAQDWDKIAKISKDISRLEHEADLTKHEIRNHLPKSLFLPIERETLLIILAVQDSLADTAEDVAILLTFRNMSPREEFAKDFQEFLNKNLECFEATKKIVQELNELLHSAFGGLEAETIRSMAHEIAYKEHEADLIQRKLLKILFNLEKEISYAEFGLWMRILESVAKISDLSEKLANTIRSTVERK